jgi:mRNA-degrading endonuclease toxin of MazEF toxin-antitoxin module
MTRNEAIGALNEVLVVLATTTIRDLPTEVRLGPDDEMPRGCVLNLDHVATVAKPPRWAYHEPAWRSYTPYAVPWMSPSAPDEPPVSFLGQ